MHATIPSRRQHGVWSARCSRGLSRGTESLVFRGDVSPASHPGTCARLQEGDFPGPVKYGSRVGRVEEADPGANLAGRMVFCLFSTPRTSITSRPLHVSPLPANVPAARACSAPAWRRQ